MNTTVFRRAMLAATAIAFAATSAVGCGASPPAQPNTSTAASSAATTSVVAQGQSVCTDLGGIVEADRNCHVRSATASSRVDVSFPVDYPDMPAVADFLKRDRGAFLDWVAEFGPPGGRGQPYQYIVTAKDFRSGTAESGTRSLVLEIDNDTGLAHAGHPNSTFQAFNFDLGKRVPITFGTLFRPGTKPLDILNPIVRRQLDAPTADLNDTAYHNFAITNEALVFFFGQDQVVPDNAGPHQVTVPRAELAAVLA